MSEQERLVKALYYAPERFAQARMRLRASDGV